MKNYFTQTKKSTFLVWMFSILGCCNLAAQTANSQATATQCFAGPTQSFTATSGTAFGSVAFTSGLGPNQIPPGHRIADITVQVVWSKSDQGGCTTPTGQPTDLSQVGFKLRKLGSPSIFLAASAGTAAFSASGPTVASFSGSFPANAPGILFDTISFQNGAPSLLPAVTPNIANDTFSTNNDPLSGLFGIDPTSVGGVWQLEAVNDPGPGPALCVHSYCITIVTCAPTALVAACKSNVTLALDNNGQVNFNITQLDSASDASCLLSSTTFTPASANCSNTGTTIPVTMRLEDRLGNVSTCVSNVTIADSTAPVLAGCLPTIVDTLFLDTFGRDTFLASSLNITDNCGSVIKEVRPFGGGAWSNEVTFSCVSGFQRIWGRGRDAAGNVDSCQYLLRIIDTVAPTAVCGADTLYLATSGTTGRFEVTANAIGVDGGSFDVCPPITGYFIGAQFAAPPTYTCADLGTQTVTLVVSDGNNNIDSCTTATITILDTIPPTINCQPDTVYLDNSGNGTAFATNFDNNSVDSCGIDSIDFGGTAGGVASLSYTCADAGTSPTVVVRVFDPSGNVDSCTTTVVILDTIPPTAICRNRTAYLDNTGNVLLTADTFNNNSVDVCTGNNLTFMVGGNTTASFDCSDIGTNPITVMVIDSNGNAATCTPNVTILDTVAPVANCASPTIYLNAAGVATLNATQLNNGSTDNCGIENYYVNTVGITSTTFTCNALNTPQNVMLIVEDTSGNTASCPTTVIVEDTIPPTAICTTSISLTLSNTGVATAQPVDIDSLSGDNCGAGITLTINGASSQTYTCADIGSNTAVLTVTDSAGQSANCSAIVNVIDNQPPIPGCQPATLFLNSSGVASLTTSDVINPAATSDNCGSFTATFAGGATNITYNCDSVGGPPRFVDVIITDNSGNQSICSPRVTVRDTTRPTAICRSSFTVQLDNNGNGFVVPMNINNNSFDICGIDTMLVNGVDTFFYTCADVGNTAAVLSIVDSSGNTATCPTSIRVSDPLPPVANCFLDTTLYLDATGSVTANPTHIDSSSTDNCTNLSLSINGAPSVNYDCSDVGSNTAFLTVTDANGNTDVCSSTINIADTISPVANCTALGAVTLFVPPGQCFQSAPASIFDNGSTDNCASFLTFTVGGAQSVTLTTLGINPITLTVSDGNGQSATCTTNAILRDTVRPTMICRTDTVQLDNNGDGIVLTSDINGGSSDNCGAPNYTINGQPSLAVDCSNLGNNTVTLIGSDASGNSDSCSAQVLVQDNIAPQARCFGTATVVLDGSTGIGTLTIADVNNNSTDNCNITSLSLSRTSYSCPDIALNPDTVFLFVLDQSGNLDSCQTRITVRDTVAPVASCVGPITRYLNTSSVSITTGDIDNGSTDNCAIQSYALSQSTFNCSDIGANTIILTVTDSSGNFETCNTTVNILDSIRPTPNCNNLTVQLDANGNVSVAATDIAAGSFDNCTIDTILVNGLDSVAYDCSNIGNNVANIYIQDESGNFITCTAIITVEDNIAPVANCITTPLNLQLDINGIAVITPADIDNGSSDNCGAVASLVISQDTFRCTDVASSPNTVTLTVTDNGGASSTCTAQVNVNDTIPPTMLCQVDTVYLGTGGVANVVAANFDNGTNDACGIASLTISGTNNPVGCADIGTRIINLIATDGNGNVDSCQTTLTILDTVPPTLVCTDDTLSLDGFGNLTIDSTTTSIYNVTDACGTGSITLNGGSSISYTCADLGANNVNITATDAGGNVATCAVVVTVQDVTPPSPTCSNSATQYLDVNGTLAVDPNWILSNVVEVCGVDTIFAAPDTMSCANIGNNNITITVIDESGNTSNCSANLPVADTIPPTMVCRDTTICLSGGFVNVNATDIDGGTTDACGLSPALTINGANNVIYTCNDIGTQVAVLERTDVNGNSDTCRATITVQDCVAPSAVCRNFTAQLDANGQVAVSAFHDIEFGSNDDCGIDSTTFAINGQDTLTYNCAFLNSPDTVLFTVADNSGNLDSCTAVITIVDNVDPVARCAGTIVRVLPGTGFVTIPAFNLDNTNNRSTDNCSISTYLINGQAADTFDCSNLGSNTVVLTVIDQDGNSDTCQTQVEIQDLTDPNVNCILNSSYVLDPTGVFNLPATALVSSSSDNCGIASVLANGQDTLVLNCDSIGSPYSNSSNGSRFFWKYSYLSLID